MVDTTILLASVYHKRFFPQVNHFRYRMYYLIFSINKISGLSRNCLLRVNKFGLMSFFEKDHSPKKNFLSWVRNILKQNDLNFTLGDVVLMAMPRILGYGFNPVSFWFCLDLEGKLRAVIAEVRNTFGENHDYLCYKSDHTVIQKHDVIYVDKIFHVSPFIKREGRYGFQFSYQQDQNNIKILIDHYDYNGKKLLSTSVSGNTIAYNSKNLLLCFILRPLVTIKTIIMIHWQALKIFNKGILYIPLPTQLKKKFSTINKKNCNR